MLKNVVITSANRTAIGSLGKSLKKIPGHELGSIVIAEAIRKSKINKERWQKAFVELRNFKEEHGHLSVPNAYRTKSGFILYSWIRTQRELKQKGLLSQEEINQLESLGFD